MLQTDRLKGIDLFSYLRAEQVDKISSASEVIFLKAGEKVYTGGDKATHFFIILTGKVYLLFEIKEHKIVPIDELTEGVMFGSCACFNMPNYFLTAKSATDSEILKIEIEVLKRIMTDDCHVGFSIQRRISEIYFKRYINSLKNLQEVVLDL